MEEIREAISYGAIKMNIDTGVQWAFLSGIRDYVTDNIDYLKTVETRKVPMCQAEEVRPARVVAPRRRVLRGAIEQAFEDLVRQPQRLSYMLKPFHPQSAAHKRLWNWLRASVRCTCVICCQGRSIDRMSASLVGCTWIGPSTG